MSGPDEIFEDEMERARYAEVELALHRALGRREAPSGFADRVMERAAAGAQPVARPGHGKLLTMPVRQWRTWASGAIAALIVLGVLQGERIHQQHERRAEAQRQFETAERITDQTLEQTREQLQRAGISLEQ